MTVKAFVAVGGFVAFQMGCLPGFSLPAQGKTGQADPFEPSSSEGRHVVGTREGEHNQEE